MKVCMDSGRAAGLLAALATLALVADAGALERATAASGLSAGSGAQQLAGERARLTRQTRKNNKKANKQLALECLAAHNKFRRLHKVADLQWDDKLAAFAQKRSNHIAESDGSAFGHPPNLPFGENLFWHSSVETACDLMVRGWYDEIKLYSFDKPSFAAETGHFTQVVWRDTQRVGCALAQSSGKRGGVYLTCSYDPAGNFLGEFVENVPRPAGTLGALKPPAKPAPVAIATTPAAPITMSTSTSTTSTTTTTSKPSSGAGETTTKPKKKKKKNKNKKKRNKKKNKKKKASTTTLAPTTIKPTLAQRARRSPLHHL